MFVDVVVHCADGQFRPATCLPAAKQMEFPKRLDREDKFSGRSVVVVLPGRRDASQGNAGLDTAAGIRRADTEGGFEGVAARPTSTHYAWIGSRSADPQGPYDLGHEMPGPKIVEYDCPGDQPFGGSRQKYSFTLHAQR